MNENINAADRGLYEKFRVERTDGRSEPGEKHHGCRYFVLDLDHDPHAVSALLAYADSCEEQYPALAVDLRSMFPDQPTEPARCAPSREDVAITLHEASGDLPGYDFDDLGEFFQTKFIREADAVQSLYANQRTEAEVKAEAWDEGYRKGQESETCDPAFWTSERFTNPYRATQPTPVFEAMGLPTPEVPAHRMIPGSHERATGPECLCGARWSVAVDKCSTVLLRGCSDV